MRGEEREEAELRNWDPLARSLDDSPAPGAPLAPERVPCRGARAVACAVLSARRRGARAGLHLIGSVARQRAQRSLAGMRMQSVRFELRSLNSCAGLPPLELWRCSKSRVGSRAHPALAAKARCGASLAPAGVCEWVCGAGRGCPNPDNARRPRSAHRVQGTRAHPAPH